MNSDVRPRRRPSFSTLLDSRGRFLAWAVLLTPVAAQEVAPDPDTEAAMRWFDGLGYPRVGDRPFVRVATGLWFRSGNEPSRNSYQYGFLLGDGGKTFEVLNVDLVRQSYTRTAKGTPAHLRVAYESIPFREHAAGILAGLADRKEAPQEHRRALSYPRVLHATGTELFVYAWACRQAGHGALAQGLADQALIALRRRWGKVSQHLPDLIAADLGHVSMWRLIEDFGDAKISYADLLKRCEQQVERFPDSEHHERAVATAALLRRMAKQRAARKAPRPLAEMTESERAAELVFRLRDQNGAQWDQPGACDIFNDPLGEESPAHRLRAMGFAAVPALLEACADDGLTRSVQYHRDFHFSHRVLRVHDCAVRILYELSGERFWAKSPEESRRLAEKWWRSVSVKGDQAVLAAGCALGGDSSPQQAAKLLQRYPGAALAAIAQGARAAQRSHIRQSLVAIAGRIEGDEAEQFLREELRSSPYVGAKVAAAIRLFQRGEAGDATAAMIAAWRQGLAGHDAERVGHFLAGCGRADAIAALAERPDLLDDDILRALEGGPQWFRSVAAPGAPSVYFELEKPTPEAVVAIEALLASRLADGREFRGNFGGTLNPRVCDFAAQALGKRWPDRYEFDFAAQRRARDRQILAVRNSWRRSQGQPLLEVPAAVRIEPAPSAALQELFGRLERETGAAARKRILAEIEGHGLGALAAVWERAGRERGRPEDAADLEGLARRLAGYVRVASGAKGAALPDAMAGRLSSMVGKRLDPDALVALLVDFTKRPPAGHAGVRLQVGRDDDGTGVEVRVGLERGDAPADGGRYEARTSVTAGKRNLHNSYGAGVRRVKEEAEGYRDFAAALQRALESPPDAPLEASWVLTLRAAKTP